MDTLTKQSQGMTKPLGAGNIPGIENLPTSFGGQKPMDATNLMGLGRGLDPAMGNAQGPLGSMASKYMPQGANFDPMSSKQDLIDYVAGKGSADDDKAEKLKAFMTMKDRLDAEGKKSQDMLFQGLDFSPIKLRGGSRGR